MYGFFLCMYLSLQVIFEMTLYTWFMQTNEKPLDKRLEIAFIYLFNDEFHFAIDAIQ